MGFKGLKPIIYGGREVWPLVEGGKGVAVSNHASSGAWAAAGGIGTVSAVNADFFDGNGERVVQEYNGATRLERHNELIQYGLPARLNRFAGRMTFRAARVRSTSTCCGKWAVRRKFWKAYWNAPRDW